MWILHDFGYKGLVKIGDMRQCENEECTGTGIVLRISFAMVLLSTFLSLLVCGVESSENPRAMIQNDGFIIKWLMLAGITVGALYLPNENAIQYGYAAAVGGGFFILIQAVLVMEFAYGWNDYLVEKFEESNENRAWAVVILGTSISLIALSITIWVLLIQNYGGDGCGETNAFVSVTVILAVISIALTLPDRVQQGAILPCSVVVLQCTFLLASAVLSIPVDADSSCPGRHALSQGTDAALVQAAGVVLTIFCVGYATIRAASSGQNLAGGAKPSTSLMGNEGGGEVGVEAEPDEESAVQYNYSFFHIIYALGAMYLAMVLIDWDIQFDDKDGQVGHMNKWASVWIKIVSQWLTFGLYVWTLIAPLVCTDRDFS